MEGISSTGDIWSTGAFSFESPLKDILDRGDFTLEELLAEDELLQELRGMHPQLIDFFSTEEAVVGLIQYVTRMQQEENTVIMNGNHAQEEEGEEKKPGQWLFPPIENPSGSLEKSPEEEKELQTVRYPYMACEVICCEINSIVDIIVDGHVPTNNLIQGHVEEQHETAVEVTTKDPPLILDLLFSLVKDTDIGTLDDYRAGYFDKILSVLFRKRPKAMSAYINNGGLTLMTAMMNHLYSHSIMQIVQRLLMPPPSSFLTDHDSNYDQDEQDNLNLLFQCQWSEFPESIQLLLDSLIVNNNDDEIQLCKAQSASEVLITVIQNSPLTSLTLLALTTDPIMATIVKAASTLKDGQDFSPHDSSLTCAMNVLESLVLQLGGYGSVGTALETASDEEEDQERANPVVNGDEASIELEVHKILKAAQEVATADTLIEHLPDLLKSLCTLLCHSSTETWKSPMQFAKDETQPLLGMSRLRIVRLIESLVLLGNPKVDAILCESDCLSICLNLFWEFQWCSMLHQSVANLLVHVFEGANERAELQEYFLVKCNLLGRLMESFEEPEEKKEEEKGKTLSDAVAALQKLHLKNRSASVQSERGSSVGSVEASFGDHEDDVIPVSDDDVDAALEQQGASELEAVEKAGAHEDTGTSATENDSTKGAEEAANEVAEVKSHIPSLRMGCLGHVIIICQALVHACTADVNESQEEAQEDANQSTLMRSVDLGESAPVASTQDQTSEPDVKEGDKGEASVPETFKAAQTIREQDSTDEGDDAQVEPSESQQESLSNDLILAQLVKSHPLHAEWNEFITSTLAAETAIQSTPLGGTNVATVESMQSQLPVARSVRTYDFSDEGEDVADISARGFLGGEVLDMDDNDLDIAASMMEALNLSRPRAPHEEGDGDMDSGGDDRQDGVSNSFGTVVQNTNAGSGDYLFDDPLGGNARFGGFGSQDDDSSDEEEASGEGASPNKEGDDDAPVMDLFTGNFDEKGESSGSVDQAATDNGTFSNFANFDDAFAAASAIEMPFSTSGSSDEDDVFKANPAAAFEATEVTEEETDIFGTTQPHTLLLGDDDTDIVGPAVETTAKEAGDKTDGVDENTAEPAAETSEGSPDSATPLENPTEESTIEGVATTEPKAEAVTSE